MFYAWLRDTAALETTIAQQVGFRGNPPDDDYTVEITRREITTLKLCWDHTGHLWKNHMAVLTPHTSNYAEPVLLAQSGIRAASNTAWRGKHGSKRHLKHQGTDHLLGLVYKMLSIA